MSIVQRFVDKRSVDQTPAPSKSALLKNLLNHFRAVLESLRSPFRKKRPAEQHNEQPSPRVSKEELQTMLPELLKDLLADPASNPELTRALRAALLGPILPFIGGTPSGTQNYIPKFNAAGNDLINTSTPIVEDATNLRIGVKTTSPGYTLDVDGDIRTRTGYLRGLNDPYGVINLTQDGILLKNPENVAPPGTASVDLRLGKFYSEVGLYRNASMEIRTDAGDLRKL